MYRSIGRSAALLSAAILVVACGGGGGTTTAPGATAAAGGGATDVPAAESLAPSTDAPAPTDVMAPSEPSAGGGSGGGVCDLATTDELKAAFGVESVTTQVFAGPPDTCAVTGPDEGSLAAWVLSDAGGGMVFDAVVLPGQSTEVVGLGDRAAFVDNTGLLIVKGDRLVTIAISADMTTEEGNAVARQIGSYIAGRM